MTRAFIHVETGAVAFDRVLLPSTLVGLGIAVMPVASGGVDRTLADTSIEFTFFGNATDAASAPFSNAESIFYGEDQSSDFSSQFSDPPPIPRIIPSLPPGA